MPRHVIFPGTNSMVSFQRGLDREESKGGEVCPVFLMLRHRVGSFARVPRL